MTDVTGVAIRSPVFTFVVAGWAKGDAAPLWGDRRFMVQANFFNTDGSVTAIDIPFNPDTDSSTNWQYIAAPAVADKPYNYIRVQVVYSYNVNTVLFDGIGLYKEEFGNSYTYDADGNVTSVKDLQKQTTTYEYTNNNLTKEILPTGAELTYEYDSHHNVTRATSEEGQVYEFTYDTWGNNTSVSIVNGGSKITSTATYSSDGNRLEKTTDALGKETVYDYDANTNVLKSVKYPEDTDATKTTYTYDSMYRVASAAATTDTGLAMSASYTYENDLLTKIQTPSTTYDFTYGSFGLRTAVKAGDQNLATYTYADRTNYLTRLDYGNGDSVQYTYDTKGRVTGQTYEEGDTVTYKYDNNGALATVEDSATGGKTTYYYDFTDRLMKYVESRNGTDHIVTYAYDGQNNLTVLQDVRNGITHGLEYRYDADNRITSVTSGSVSKHYSYDAWGRVSQLQSKHYDAVKKTETYTYTSGGDNSTSSQIATHYISNLNATYTYTYDDNGNILSVTDGITSTSYVYDSANQLIREDNQTGGFTYTWTYDNAGNILEYKAYNYTAGSLENVIPTDTVTYTYGNANWGDVLTGFDGETVTSDAIGNMTAKGGQTYTWKHGRQLDTMSNATNQASYTYNVDGLRISKTVNGQVHTFTWIGDKIVQENYADVDKKFFYDAQGRPDHFTYNGVLFYYVLNIMGDVTGILDESGNLCGSYLYDAWGNIVYQSGYGADLNPIRYRGYFHDSESGLYYLQSRYYDPELGRFINADDVDLLGANGDFAGYNLFVYCGNNPVSRADDNGDLWHIVAGAAFGAATSILSEVICSVITGEEITLANVVGAAVGGAVRGGLTAAGVPVMAANAVGAAVTSVTTGVINGDDAKTIARNTAVSVATSVAVDGAFGAVGKVAKHAVSGKYTKLSTVGKVVKKITYEPKYLNKKAVSTVTTGILKNFLTDLPVEVALRFGNKAYC